MSETLTVFLVVRGESAGLSLGVDNDAVEASTVRLSPEQLVREVPAASIGGAVVVIVDTDADATTALGLGADEVLRIGEFTAAELNRTLERARLRASARALRDQRAGGMIDGRGFTLLGAALGEQLVAPLASATAECALLADTLRVLLSINDDLVGWAALSAPVEELRRLAARRLAAPSTSEVTQALSRMQSAVSDARFVANKLQVLVADSEHDGSLPADRLVSEFATLIAPQIASVALLEVEEPNTCQVQVPAAFFLSVAAILVSNALQAFRVVGKTDGRIVVTSHDTDGSAVLSIEDDAGEMDPDLSGLERASENVSRASIGLSALRKRLTACGGDLLVQSDETGTQVRVVFPAVAEFEALATKDSVSSASTDLEPLDIN